jgi:hypothetical protein
MIGAALRRRSILNSPAPSGAIWPEVEFAVDSPLEGDGFELPVREHRAMAPSHGFAAASHREAVLRGRPPPMARPRSEAQRGSVRPAAAMRSTHREMRCSAAVPLPTAKSLPLAPAGTASNFAWSGKKTATLYRVTVPADPVLVHGNRLGGAKGP